MQIQNLTLSLFWYVLFKQGNFLLWFIYFFSSLYSSRNINHFDNINIFCFFCLYVIVYWIPLFSTILYRLDKKLGLEGDEDEEENAKKRNRVGFNDILDALDLKYDSLRRKLFWEMIKKHMGEYLILYKKKEKMYFIDCFFS